MAKFKVGDKVRVREDLELYKYYGDYRFTPFMEKFKGKTLIITKMNFDHSGYILEGICSISWTDEMLEEVKEEFSEEDIEFLKEVVDECNKMKEKTFREVIADIKEGEVWESKDKIVRCLFDGIQIYHKDKERSTPSMLMLDDYKFTLQRKEYTFEEAFKAYEEGKEIESRINRYRKINGKDGFYSRVDGSWKESDIGLCFRVKEIRGKWYIND